jgi:DNA-binding response OmpR family regulator
MKRVLVVENNPLIASAVEAAGARLQMHIDRATDGWDAITLLESETYDAIVIDADLPLHSGYGVLTYLHEEVGTMELGNVIVMSADADHARQYVPGDRVRVMQTTGDAEEMEQALRV